MSDPLERRDWFVDAQAKRFRAAGVTVPTESLQRQAADDLRLLDRARSEGALKSRKDPRKATVAEPSAQRELKAEAQAAGIGATVRRRTLPKADKARRLAPLRGVSAQKTYAMVARLRLIGTRNGHRLRTGQDMEHGFAYAALARAAAEETTNHNAGRGEYVGKTAADRDRILFRRLGDICDRSDAVVGIAWWVK